MDDTEGSIRLDDLYNENERANQKTIHKWLIYISFVVDLKWGQFEVNFIQFFFFLILYFALFCSLGFFNSFFFFSSSYLFSLVNFRSLAPKLRFMFGPRKREKKTHFCFRASNFDR